MNSILYPLCAVLACLAAVYELLRLRRQPDASLITLCAAFVLLAATFIISTPAVWQRIDRLVGYPNISALLSQGSVIIFTATLQVLLLLWLNPPEIAWAKIRPRFLAFSVALTAMITLFLLAPTAPENPTEFAASNAGQPYYAAYLLLYVAAFAALQIEVIRLCVRYARLCDRPWLRRGLRTATVGAAFGLVYCLGRTADVAGALSGLDVDKWETVPRLGAGGGEILYLIGWTMPAWGPRLSAAQAWMANYRAHRHLYPLWSALFERNPQIALDPPKSWIHDVLNTRDLSFRLHRRMVEIQDGRLSLRPYMADPAQAPGRVDPAAEAARLRIAMDAKAVDASSDTTTDSASAPLAQQADPPKLPDAATQNDFADEMKWLVAVARAFRGSPGSPGSPASAAAVTYRDDHTRPVV